MTNRHYDDDDEFDEPHNNNNDGFIHDTGGLNPLQARILATEWAEKIMKDNAEKLMQADRPYVLATLIEAGMFERPIKKLACGITDSGDLYAITLKGYKNLMSDKLWGNIFLSKEKSQLLKNVKDTFTQMTDDGLIKVIHVEKIKFSGSGDGDNDYAIGSGRASAVPSASRRFRRRD